jgi:hypothetical protein
MKAEEFWKIAHAIDQEISKGDRVVIHDIHDNEYSGSKLSFEANCACLRDEDGHYPVFIDVGIIRCVDLTNDEDED